jgi:hypothetical protein
VNREELLVTLDVFIAATAVAVALMTYVMTAKRDRDLRRSELVKSFTVDFYASNNVVQLFTDIDYNRFEFSPDEESWLGHQPEQTVVRMLDVFNSIGLSWRRGIVTLDDIHGTTLGYAIQRSVQCPGMRDYLTYVHNHDQSHLGTGVPFEFFQEIGLELQERSARCRARNAARPALVADDPTRTNRPSLGSVQPERRRLGRR